MHPQNLYKLMEKTPEAKIIGSCGGVGGVDGGGKKEEKIRG